MSEQVQVNVNPVCVMGVGTAVAEGTLNAKQHRRLLNLYVERSMQKMPVGRRKSNEGKKRLKQLKELRVWLNRMTQVCGIDERHASMSSKAVGFTSMDLADIGSCYHRLFHFEHDLEPPYLARREFWKKHASALAAKSSGNALKAWGGDKGRISFVIVHSVSGWSMPSLAHHVIFNHDLSSECRAMPVTMAGCHAGFLVAAVARSCLMSPSCPNEKSAVALAMTGDEMGSLCKAYHGKRSLDRDLHLANVLFGEGSAAVVLGRPTSADLARASSGGFPIWEYHVPRCLYIPDSADALAMYLSQNESEYFSTTIKKHLAMHINTALMRNFSKKFNKLFKGLGRSLKLDDVDYVVHPGGKALLDLFARVAKAFGHPDPQSTVARSMESLRTHGNMSSSSVLFILKDTILNTKKNHLMGVSMGPGVSMEFSAFSRWGHGPHFAKLNGKTRGISLQTVILSVIAFALVAFILGGFSVDDFY